jgi:carbon monoxide dehydrogenase subunit G
MRDPLSRIRDLDPPNSYRISGEGEGSVAGFAKGGAKVSLADKDGGTLLSYNVETQIGGKLAQLGQRGQEDCRRFLSKFRRRVTPKMT